MIHDARVMLNVRTPNDWRQKQQRVLAAATRLDARATEQIVSDPMSARIEQNRWLFDCHCGAGVAVHPDWPDARCLALGCGRTYTHVQIPADRHEIEAVLEARPVLTTRNWAPPETVEMLRAENAAHGLKVVT